MWQPIETAPCDGTPILVYLEEPSQKSRVHAAFFRQNMRIISGHFDYDMPKATHWMPLPEPPQ